METHCTYYFFRHDEPGQSSPGEGFEKLALVLTSSGSEVLISFPEDYKKPTGADNRPIAIKCESVEEGKVRFRQIADEVAASGFLLDKENTPCDETEEEATP